MLTDITERDVPKGASLSLSSGKGKKVSHVVPEKGGNDRPSSFFLRELRRSARSLGRFGLGGGGTCVGQGGHAAFRRCRPAERGKGPRCTHAPAEKQRESSGRHGASKVHPGQDVLEQRAVERSGSSRDGVCRSQRNARRAEGAGPRSSRGVEGRGGRGLVGTENTMRRARLPSDSAFPDAMMRASGAGCALAPENGA